MKVKLWNIYRRDNGKVVAWNVECSMPHWNANLVYIQAN